MSTIRADNVAPSAGGTSRSLVRGTAAAWVNFNGTGTIAARDSENVSSLTDNGTGDYTTNWTNAFSSVNYAYAHANDVTSGATINQMCLANLHSQSTGALRLVNANTGATSLDVAFEYRTAHGDLA